MKSFKLGNIKAFKETSEIEVKPITLFIGHNSSGKSSLVRFPLVMKQTVEEQIGPILLYGKHMDYGNYEDAVYNHDESHNMYFELKYDIDDFAKICKRLYPPSYLKKFNLLSKVLNEKELTVTVEIGKTEKNRIIKGELEVKHFAINADFVNVLQCDLISGNKYQIIVDGEWECDRQLDFTSFIPDISIERFPNKANEESEDGNNYINRDIRLILRALEQLILNNKQNISYIGPFRSTPERNYRYREASISQIGAFGENTPEVLASYHRRNDEKFFKRLNSWLENHLEINVAIDEIKGGLFRINVIDLKRNCTNNISDVGFGLSQILPIIVQIFMKKEMSIKNRNSRIYGRYDRLNIIEQPELHLHPSAQADLMDLFIEGCKIDRYNKYMIETHSEHLILRLRRRILDGTIDPSDVAIYYVENQDNGLGYSTIHNLNVNVLGDIEGWPDDFFSQDFDEIVKISEEKSKRDRGTLAW